MIALQSVLFVIFGRDFVRPPPGALHSSQERIVTYNCPNPFLAFSGAEMGQITVQTVDKVMIITCWHGSSSSENTDAFFIKIKRLKQFYFEMMVVFYILIAHTF